MSLFVLVILSSAILKISAQDLQKEDQCTINLPKSNVTFQQLIGDKWYVQSTNIAPSICTTMQFLPKLGEDSHDGFLNYTTFQGDKEFKGSYMLENVGEGKYIFYNSDRNSTFEFKSRIFNSNCSITLFENQTQMFILACIKGNLYYFAVTRQQKVDENIIAALETQGKSLTDYPFVEERFIVQVDKCFMSN